MSRLQKKKPAREKKKQRTIARNPGDLSSDSSGHAGLKSTASASLPKVKPGKKIIETKLSEPNFLQKALDFFREVKLELKKVTWPTRKQTTGTTIVVIVFIFILAAFLGLFDFGLSKLVQVVLT